LTTLSMRRTIRTMPRCGPDGPTKGAAMSTKETKEPSQTTDRESVKDTMEKGTEKQPGEFRDEANEDKVVAIGKDVKKDPIKGIDPKR
jgi:hypothetical protein